MLTIRWRIAALLLVTIILVAAGGLLLPHGAQGDAAAGATAKVPRELLEKRRDEAKIVWESKWEPYARTRGRWPASDLLGWSERLLEAELPLLDKEERVNAFQDHLDRTRKFERLTIALASLGMGRASDAHAATYERLNAEVRYFEGTGKAPPPPPEINNGPPAPEKRKGLRSQSAKGKP